MSFYVFLCHSLHSDTIRHSTHWLVPRFILLFIPPEASKLSCRSCEKRKQKLVTGKFTYLSKLIFFAHLFRVFFWMYSNNFSLLCQKREKSIKTSLFLNLWSKHKIYDQFSLGYSERKQEKKLNFISGRLFLRIVLQLASLWFFFSFLFFSSQFSPDCDLFDNEQFGGTKKSPFTIVTNLIQRLCLTLEMVFGIYLTEIGRFIKCFTLTKAKSLYIKWVNNWVSAKKRK